MQLSRADHSGSPPKVEIPRGYNAAHDLVERNLVAGRAAKAAFIDDEGGHTYGELAERVNRAAQVLTGLGLEMVREMVEGGSLAGVRWVLHTGDAHGMYRLVGFGDPSPRTMERLPGDHR